MSGKKNLVLFAAALLLIAVGAAFFFVYQFVESERAEQIHYERDETELVVANTTNANLTLFRAGNKLDDAQAVPDFNGERMWLTKGNYFLRAEQNGKTSFYPVPIQGYRSGTEKDDSFSVTIRPIPDIEPPTVLSDSPKFVFIPSGSFLMGDRQNPTEPHYVWTQGYFVAPFEVSNAEFRQFLEATDGYQNSENWTTQGKDWKAKNPSQVSARLSESDAEFKRFGQPDQPVTSVNWFEAVAFCHWLTKKFGEANRLIYALPSEAEWEKAARGPDSFDYPLGQTISDAETKLYNWRKNPGAEVTVIGIKESAGNFTPNRYGIYHLGGNVVEWTQTLRRSYNRENPYADDDDRNREDLPGVRVVRGGSWYSATNGVLSIAYRENFPPEVSHNDLGFRLIVRPLP